MYHEETCIFFQPRQNQTGYIHFVMKENKCESDIGFRGKQQNITFDKNCFNKLSLIHLIGRALGFIRKHNKICDTEHLKMHNNETINVISNSTQTTNGSSIVKNWVCSYDHIPDVTSYPKNELGLSCNDTKELNKLYKCFKEVGRRSSAMNTCH